MTTRPSKPADPLELLRGAPIGVATPHEIDLERARLVPWLEGQVAQFPLEQRRQLRRRRLVAISAVAGIAAAVALAWSLGPGWSLEPGLKSTSTVAGAAAAASEAAANADSPSVQLVEGSVESQAISAGSRFAATSQVRTREAQRAVFVGDGGYRVTLSPNTELSFGARHDTPPTGTEVARTRLELAKGEVELSVPKLAPGSTLEVHTPSAIVRVRGTRFGVALGEGGGTCVRVTEGLVEVERPSGIVFVAAGQNDGCADSVDAGAVDGGAADAGAATGAVGSTTKGRVSGQASTLSEESRWLGTALSAERAGERAAAHRAYGELLKRYPATRFSPEARAGLSRTAESTGE